jgi:hypothetical protein
MDIEVKVSPSIRVPAEVTLPLSSVMTLAPILQFVDTLLADTVRAVSPTSSYPLGFAKPALGYITRSFDHARNLQRTRQPRQYSFVRSFFYQKPSLI